MEELKAALPRKPLMSEIREALEKYWLQLFRYNTLHPLLSKWMNRTNEKTDRPAEAGNATSTTA